VEVGSEYPNMLVERDISSSQTQLLAAFLGLDDLEVLASRERPNFKEYLAHRLWRLHVRTRGKLLAPGYTGPDDARLIAFVKELWMRRNYGGKFNKTVYDLANDPATYGRGWNSDVFATGGVRRAERYWRYFLRKLPAWSHAVTQFLDACRYIGRNADHERGLVFPDPLDGADVQWNPVCRVTRKLAVGKNHLEFRPAGVMRTRGKTRRFIKRWQVNTNELAVTKQ
jgi:hypothetical protein